MQKKLPEKEKRKYYITVTTLICLKIALCSCLKTLSKNKKRVPYFCKSCIPIGLWICSSNKNVESLKNMPKYPYSRLGIVHVLVNVFGFKGLCLVHVIWTEC